MGDTNSFQENRGLAGIRGENRSVDVAWYGSRSFLGWADPVTCKNANNIMQKQ
jgi:hypothetical protein